MIRLLIADDECLEREALTEMVSRRFEHEAVLETAENGRKAADTAILWGADLILMDIEMPGMSGLDAARAVLAQRPGCRVIFVTAYSLFQYAHEAVHLGACDYLLKPVDPDELEASIRRAMRQIETERKLEALAPVQPEPMEPAAPAAEPDDAENSQNALVMAHVRRYLEDNYMFDISLDSVGEILHISPAYLSAQFKKYQKMNFLDCLTELRINAAKELLTWPPWWGMRMPATLPAPSRSGQGRLPPSTASTLFGKSGILLRRGCCERPHLPAAAAAGCGGHGTGVVCLQKAAGRRGTAGAHPALRREPA